MVKINFHSQSLRDPFLKHVEKLSRHCEHLDIAVGFISKNGMGYINDFLKLNASLKIRLVVGDITGNTTAVIGALDPAIKKRIECRIHLGSKSKSSRYSPMMHTKLFIGKRGTIRQGIIGSSNMSYFAMKGQNIEGNIILSGDDEDTVFEDMQEHFDGIWDESHKITPALAVFYHSLSRFRHRATWGYPELRGPYDANLDGIREIPVDGIWFLDTTLPFKFIKSDDLNVFVNYSGSGRPKSVPKANVNAQVLIIPYDSSKSLKSRQAYLCKVDATVIPKGTSPVRPKTAKYNVLYDPTTSYFKLWSHSVKTAGARIMNHLVVEDEIAVGSISFSPLNQEVGAIWESLETDQSHALVDLEQEEFVERDAQAKKSLKHERIIGFKINPIANRIVQSLSASKLVLKKLSLIHI